MTEGTSPGTGNAPVVIRAATQADVPFIVDSWLWSYWDDQRREQHGSRLIRSAFEQGQRRTIARLLSSAVGYVACVPEVPDEICGYAIVGGGVLHYLLVKQVYRRNGVATKLLDATGLGDFAVSHLTKLGALALRDRLYVYDPHARER